MSETTRTYQTLIRSSCDERPITFRFKKWLKGWYVLATTNINPPSLITDKEKGGHVTLDLPVRNRSRHVWKQWGQLNKKCSAALTARFRTVKADPRARQNIS